MAAGVKIQHKRKAGAFIAGELAAGEMGVDTTNGTVYFSADGSTVNKILSSSSVPLGRWSGTSAGSAPLDNIFDDALYSHYTIVGQFLPATNGANLSAVLRDATPSDVGGGLIAGQTYSSMATVVAGGTNNTALQSSVSSTVGISSFSMTLYPPGVAAHSHAFETAVTVFQSSGDWYAFRSGGFFGTSTPRQGIKFFFSTGNIASGWFEVTGHKKQ